MNTSKRSTGRSGFSREFFGGTARSRLKPLLQNADRRAWTASRLARGFGLISAIFLMVVLSALGAYLVNIGTVQQATGVLSLRQARAYAAAQSGLEWAIYRALSTTASCASASFDLSEGALNGFTIEVTCSVTVHRLRNTDVSYYALQATARRGSFGDPDFVSRSLSATVADRPP